MLKLSIALEELNNQLHPQSGEIDQADILEVREIAEEIKDQANVVNAGSVAIDELVDRSNELDTVVGVAEQIDQSDESAVALVGTIAENAIAGLPETLKPAGLDVAVESIRNRRTLQVALESVEEAKTGIWAKIKQFFIWLKDQVVKFFNMVVNGFKRLFGISVKSSAEIEKVAKKGDDSEKWKAVDTVSKQLALPAPSDTPARLAITQSEVNSKIADEAGGSTKSTESRFPIILVVPFSIANSLSVAGEFAGVSTILEGSTQVKRFGKSMTNITEALADAKNGKELTMGSIELYNLDIGLHYPVVSEKGVEYVKRQFPSNSDNLSHLVPINAKEAQAITASLSQSDLGAIDKATRDVEVAFKDAIKDPEAHFASSIEAGTIEQTVTSVGSAWAIVSAGIGKVLMPYLAERVTLNNRIDAALKS